MGNPDKSTPLQKANDLVKMYYNVFAFNNTFTNFNQAMEKRTNAYRQSVLASELCVQEILSLHMVSAMGRNDDYSEGEFWELVKEELVKYR